MTTATKMANDPAINIGKEKLLRLYERMVAIRLFEERVNDLYTRALMPGLAHLYIGEEAIAVGICEALKSDDYITEQVFYQSKDGTRVPMFITYRKGIEKNGTNPTLLSGYGGFNISNVPNFSPAVATWLEMGGVYAVANSERSRI